MSMKVKGDIKELNKVRIVIQKENDLSDLFGKFKTKKTPQELKDEPRDLEGI